MATIRASCSTCGDVELTTDDVTVRVCTTNDHGEYWFRCPSCTMVTSKPAERPTIDLLVASGVAMTTWSLPLELFEQHDGAPISHEDLLEFTKMLECDTTLADAISDLPGV